MNQILYAQEKVGTEQQKRIQVLEQQVRVQNQTIQRLVFNSWMNIRQSYGYIDKAKLDYEMLLPFSSGSNEPRGRSFWPFWCPPGTEFWVLYVSP